MYEIKIDRLLSMMAIVLAFSLPWFSASEAQLQPITTTTLCTDAPTCAAALLPNVNGAILRRPTSDVLGNSHVAIVIVHDSSSYINFSACSALAQRGYTELCVSMVRLAIRRFPVISSTTASSRSSPQLPRQSILQKQRDRACNYQSRYLRTQRRRVTAAVLPKRRRKRAEEFQGRESCVPCIDDNLHNLPKADGVIIFDAHPGLGFGQFTYVDPSIIVNDEPPGNVAENRDPTLDMFSVANGYDASTNSGDYAKRFERRFLKAQQDRNQELLDTALKLLRQERIFTGNPKALGDDIPFTVVAGNAARLATG